MTPLVIGVDGCRGGWVAAGPADGVKLFQSFAALAEHYLKHGDASLLVDIPMGLPQSRVRDIEAQARALLGSRASSVFAVPCRAAIYAEDYRSACDLNQDAFGNKLSMQLWNICPRIRETDAYLLGHREHMSRIVECHPELTFARLAGRRLEHNKKTPAGLDERLRILAQFLDDPRGRYEDALSATLRKAVARDDILDAMALQACGQTGYELLTGEPAMDEQGIPIRMAIPSVPSADSRL